MKKEQLCAQHEVHAPHHLLLPQMGILVKQKYLFHIIILSLCGMTCGCMSPVNDEPTVVYHHDLSVEENVAGQAVAFQNDSTFPFLDELAQTRSLIILGESTHMDSTTQAIKTKMIMHLKQKNFRTIFFEFGSFITMYVYTNPEYESHTGKWLFEYVFYDFNPCLQPLYDRIRNKEIKAFSIDVNAHYYDIDAIKIILNKYLKDDMLIMDWDKLKAGYARKFINPDVHDQPPMEIREQQELMKNIDLISNYTHYLIHKKGKTMDLEAVLQWIRNINTLFSFIIPVENGVNIYREAEKIALPYRNRDYQMAENVLWLMERFPNEKAILWAANYHGAKDISQTLYPDYPELYFIHQCAGEGLYHRLGDKLYSLAFTSLNPTFNDNPQYYQSGLFEAAIAAQTHDAPFAFVDFEHLRFADEFRDQSFEASMIGTRKKPGRWLYIFDGIYYVRDQRVVR
ncbi:MAG: erythromycin esterase family protein [Tannerellaceae bacterium]|nr:erythromycin esterase family protein [Tannerellaceae bacterium]